MVEQLLYVAVTWQCNKIYPTFSYEQQCGCGGDRSNVDSKHMFTFTIYSLVPSIVHYTANCKKLGDDLGMTFT